MRIDELQVGDTVIAISNYYNFTTLENQFIGEVTAIHGDRTFNVRCIGSRRSSPSMKQDFGGLDPRHFEIVKKSEPKPKKIKDPRKMDALVIDPAIKEEIVAVLKQHDNSKRLFEEWGLGEVITYGKGMSFLFYGPPGTGKTWAAHCISESLGQDLLIIGSAEIQTSEPGGANRNIVNAFKACTKDKKVLFLDECDSLITVRSDVGMIIGSEINTLLTEIEKFEGIVILATNRVDTLDPALERRISLIVEFPEPDTEARETIWTRMLPKKMPLEKGLNPKKLSEFALTGGQIKNVVLQAARLAIADESDFVGFKHFESAISRVLSSKNLMGNASRYRQIAIKDSISTGRTSDTSPDIVKTEGTDKVRDVVPEKVEPIKPNKKSKK